MQLTDLRPALGSRKKRKIRGRGEGSGHGKTSCRGSKGQRSRSGHHIRLGFEGGQMSLIRRIPKRGFNRLFNNEFQIVNLKDLSKAGKQEIIGPLEMKNCGLIASEKKPVKILGEGELAQALTVKANKFSHSAKMKIEKAGGKAELITKLDKNSNDKIQSSK